MSDDEIREEDIRLQVLGFAVTLTAADPLSADPGPYVKLLASELLAWVKQTDPESRTAPVRMGVTPWSA